MTTLLILIGAGVAFTFWYWQGYLHGMDVGRQQGFDMGLEAGIEIAEGLEPTQPHS